MQLFPRLTIDPYYQRRKDSPGSIHFIFSDVTCTDRVKQGRTQYGADGAKATLPEIKKKIIIYSFKYGPFYVLQFVQEVSFTIIL